MLWYLLIIILVGSFWYNYQRGYFDKKDDDDGIK